MDDTPAKLVAAFIVLLFLLAAMYLGGVAVGGLQ